MKNVLIINGSPRKGETQQAAEMLAAMLREKGNVNINWLQLGETKLGQCRGCHLCIQRGENYCPLRDDRDLIMEAMKQADGIVIASPVYSQNVSTILKNMIDHFAYLYHRPSLFGKKVMALATGGGKFSETLHYIGYNAGCWGMNYVCGAGVPHFDALQPAFRKKVIHKLDRAVRKFYRALVTEKEVKPGIGDLMWFRMWQMTARSCKDSNPADFDHYLEQGWFTSSYYYPVKIPVHRRMIRAAITPVLRFGMRKMYTGY